MGFPDVQKVLNRAWFGAFEMNPAWVGGDRKEETLQRMVPAPYVVDASRLAGTSTQLHNHEISVFFAAHRRPNAAQKGVRHANGTKPVVRAES